MHNENKYEGIYIVIFGELNKSNFWVSILLFRILGDVITGILDNYSRSVIDRVRNKKILLLIPDDMAYTGTQLVTSIQDFSMFMGGVLTLSNITVLIACPYIGSGAIRPFLSHNIRINNTSEIVYTFLEHIMSNNPTERKLINKEILNDYFGVDRIYYRAFLYSYNLYLIYFDHKLADSLSIFQKMLALGTYYNCDNTIGLMGPLIKDCKLSDYKVNNIIPSPYLKIDDFDSMNVCPLPYYKTIQYTYKRNVLDTNDEINLAEIFAA